MVAGENDDSNLPPWLFSNAPKRKKWAISPEDFDFNQIVPIKPKTTKNVKTLTRVNIDKNKNKYVEVVDPPSNAIIGQVQDSDYVIHRIEVGKQTHDFVVQDA